MEKDIYSFDKSVETKKKSNHSIRYLEKADSKNIKQNEDKNSSELSSSLNDKSSSSFGESIYKENDMKKDFIKKLKSMKNFKDEDDSNFIERYQKKVASSKPPVIKKYYRKKTGVAITKRYKSRDNFEEKGKVYNLKNLKSHKAIKKINLATIMEQSFSEKNEKISSNENRFCNNFKNNNTTDNKYNLIDFHDKFNLNKKDELTNINPISYFLNEFNSINNIANVEEEFNKNFINNRKYKNFGNIEFEADDASINICKEENDQKEQSYCQDITKNRLSPSNNLKRKHRSLSYINYKSENEKEKQNNSKEYIPNFFKQKSVVLKKNTFNIDIITTQSEDNNSEIKNQSEMSSKNQGVLPEVNMFTTIIEDIEINKNENEFDDNKLIISDIDQNKEDKNKNENLISSKKQTKNNNIEYANIASLHTLNSMSTEVTKKKFSEKFITFYKKKNYTKTNNNTINSKLKIDESIFEIESKLTNKVSNASFSKNNQHSLDDEVNLYSNKESLNNQLSQTHKNKTTTNVDLYSNTNRIKLNLCNDSNRIDEVVENETIKDKENKNSFLSTIKSKLNKFFKSKNKSEPKSELNQESDCRNNDEDKYLATFKNQRGKLHNLKNNTLEKNKMILELLIKAKDVILE